MVNKVSGTLNTLNGFTQDGFAFQKPGGGTKIDGGLATATDDRGTIGRYLDTQITSAQILALNATPVVVVPAPGAGLVNIPRYFQIFMPYNSAAYAGIAAGENLEFRYTDGSGQLIATVETDPFLTLTANAMRTAYPTPATTSDITPVANAAIVIRLAVGEITTGNSPLVVRTFYDTLPSTLGV